MFRGKLAVYIEITADQGCNTDAPAEAIHRNDSFKEQTKIIDFLFFCIRENTDTKQSTFKKNDSIPIELFHFLENGESR